MKYSLDSSKPTGMIQHLYESFMRNKTYNQRKGEYESQDVLDVLFYRYCHVLFKPQYLPIVEEFLAMPPISSGNDLVNEREDFEWQAPSLDT